jgi:hypothetical protein
MPVCREIDPPTQEVAPGRWVACHLHDAAIMARPDARPEPAEAAAAASGRELRQTLSPKGRDPTRPADHTSKE